MSSQLPGKPVNTLLDSISRFIGIGHAKPSPLLALSEHYRLRSRLDRKRSVKDLEWLFFRLARKLDPALFFEIGAKDARTSVRARKHAPHARIAAFEANPLNFARFKHNPKLAASNVEYRNLALSGHDGEVTFNLVDFGGSPSNGRGSLLNRASGRNAHSAGLCPANASTACSLSRPKTTRVFGSTLRAPTAMC
jgi:FkbM family methyltransferase